jgi:hypothetical protein
MGNRCLHELKTSNADEAAAQMDEDEPSASIEESDLGSSVLTLTEIL